MTVECFPGIRTEHLHRFTENWNLENWDTVVIHVGSKDLRSTRKLDYLMEVEYSLVATAKSKFPHFRLVVSDVLRRRDVTWRRKGKWTTHNNWAAKTLGIAFVDPNSWIKDGAFGRDELLLNRRGARRLGYLNCTMCNCSGERSTMGNMWQSKQLLFFHVASAKWSLGWLFCSS
jgi:hypothetical protein